MDFGGFEQGDDDHALPALLQRAVLVDLGLDVGFGEINPFSSSPAAQLSDAVARARRRTGISGVWRSSWRVGQFSHPFDAGKCTGAMPVHSTKAR